MTSILSSTRVHAGGPISVTIWGAAALVLAVGSTACGESDGVMVGPGLMATGGVLLATGGVDLGTGGELTATGGMILTSGGLPAATGGSMPATGGMATGGMSVDAELTGGMVAESGGDELGTGGVEEPIVAPREDLGEGDPEEVIAIGDSWMSLFFSGIQQSLVAHSGRRYRTYGVPGTRLLNEQIPNQYTSAKAIDADIKTVIMTGGGNDIIQVSGLREDCDAGGDLCETEVVKILDRLSEMWAEMAADGVQDVLYVEYSTPEGAHVDFELPSGDNVEIRCAAVQPPLRCHTLRTLEITNGDFPDDIHPSSAGYDLIAEAVYTRMIDEGMRR